MPSGPNSLCELQGGAANPTCAHRQVRGIAGGNPVMCQNTWMPAEPTAQLEPPSPSLALPVLRAPNHPGFTEIPPGRRQEQRRRPVDIRTAGCALAPLLCSLNGDRHVKG